MFVHQLNQRTAIDQLDPGILRGEVARWLRKSARCDKDPFVRLFG
jgi:hypothetical protein